MDSLSELLRNSESGTYILFLENGCFAADYQLQEQPV
jgi:hypothetical protein